MPCRIYMLNVPLGLYISNAYMLKVSAIGIFRFKRNI